MRPGSERSHERHASAWQRELLTGARTLSDLVARGLLDASAVAELGPVAERFELLVPDYYLRLVDPTDPACPIRLQCVPDVRELTVEPGELTDPIGDSAHERTPILVHRYPDRLLLFPTYRCPMFCRYCFRKVRLNDEDPVGLRHDLPNAIAYLREHPEVREVILSGGDPLVLSDRRLDEVLTAMRAAESVRAVRIHTRTPATLPARVTPELAAVLATHRPLTVVTHYNHAKELTPTAERAIEALLSRGIPVLNQSVLLRGVNDSDDALLALLRGLSERMVRPYYLHHPDLTIGTQHLRVSLDRGLELTRALRGRLPGHAIPTYVLDIPGGLGKVPIDSGFVTKLEEPGLWRVVSPFGPVVTYRDLGAA